jgi:hypothetical protein
VARRQKLSADLIDVSGHSPQQRLTHSGCYHGAIDGASSAALDEALKQCPDMKPFLRIETGMDTAAIAQFGSTPHVHGL